LCFLGKGSVIPPLRSASPALPPFSPSLWLFTGFFLGLEIDILPLFVVEIDFWTLQIQQLHVLRAVCLLAVLYLRCIHDPGPPPILTRRFRPDTPRLTLDSQDGSGPARTRSLRLSTAQLVCGHRRRVLSFIFPPPLICRLQNQSSRGMRALIIDIFFVVRSRPPPFLTPQISQRFLPFPVLLRLG